MPILALDALLSLREQWRCDQCTLVFTNGVFDLLHRGHITYLEQARALGDVLVVGLNSDTSTRALKGPRRPLMSEDDRAYLLAALRCVDYVTIFTETTAKALVRTLQPDVYVKGGDYALTTQSLSGGDGDVPTTPAYARLPEAPIVERYGGRVALLPYRSGCSTTQLITRIVERFGEIPHET